MKFKHKDRIELGGPEPHFDDKIVRSRRVSRSRMLFMMQHWMNYEDGDDIAGINKEDYYLQQESDKTHKLRRKINNGNW